MDNQKLIEKLKEFIECEARSCSMDPGCITPEYVYRMWGGVVAIEDIATAMEEVRRKICSLMYEVGGLNDEQRLKYEG